MRDGWRLSDGSLLLTNPDPGTAADHSTTVVYQGKVYDLNLKIPRESVHSDYYRTNVGFEDVYVV